MIPFHFRIPLKISKPSFHISISSKPDPSRAGIQSVCRNAIKTVGEQPVAARDFDPEGLGEKVSVNHDFGYTRTSSGWRKDDLKPAEFAWTQDLTAACVHAQREVGAGDAHHRYRLHCKSDLASVLDDDHLRG